MNAQEIARAITSIAFMKQTQEQKSPDAALAEAEKLVELVLEHASSLAKTYEASPMVVFQQILAQAQIGMGKGAKGDNAISDAAAGVRATLIKAKELEQKYA